MAVKRCPSCDIALIEGLNECWHCYSGGKFLSEGPVCSCGVHLSEIRLNNMKGCNHYKTVCECGKEIPDNVDKCFKCAMRERKKFYTQLDDGPVSYLDKSHWEDEWWEAYYQNALDMALISGNKEEFLKVSKLINQRRKTV